MPRASKPEANKSALVFHFKLTLLEVQPLIWRRVQVPDGTLDKLHEHIQTAMGWTNSHLHQFEIAGRRYGDPELLDNGWEEDDFVDSTKLRLSRLLDKKRKSFRFYYEYDFGDGWRHEIVYEGALPAESNVKYPRCVDGARACPPEDVGGPWGYADCLEALRNPKHQEHREMREWIGGRFDPEKFAAATATKAMQRGLPDWRKLR
ncbi:MAG: plasmid pRiA4b ORF-3 family protein [Pirellulales bacterium]|nr:plasmid pRiA4b ORF-3 family protein [Pirellulales bacterium]